MSEKLSALIRKGAKLSGQHFGGMFYYDEQYIYTCAMGAALLALVGRDRFDKAPEFRGGLFLPQLEKRAGVFVARPSYL